MREMVERKQGSCEGITTYSDDLLRMGRKLVDSKIDWEKFVVEVFITNLRDNTMIVNMKIDGNINDLMMLGIGGYI